MQSCANAKERTYDDWASLFAKVDPRFKLRSVTTPLHSALSIIEVVWMGGSSQTGDLYLHSPDRTGKEALAESIHLDQGSVSGASVDVPRDYLLAPDEYETSLDGSELSYMPERASPMIGGTSKLDGEWREVRIVDSSRVSRHWLFDDECD